jgi:hypothetical protein
VIAGLGPEAWETLVAPSTWRIVAYTAIQAAASTVLSVLLALPAAYALYRLEIPARRTLLAIITVPFILPTIVVGLAFREILNPRTLERRDVDEHILAAIVCDNKTVALFGRVPFDFAFDVDSAGKINIVAIAKTAAAAAARRARTARTAGSRPRSARTAATASACAPINLVDPHDLRPLFAGTDLALDLGTLGRRRQARLLKRCRMQKHVGRTVGGGDEAEAFCGVEPFDNSFDGLGRARIERRHLSRGTPKIDNTTKRHLPPDRTHKLLKNARARYGGIGT